MSLVDQIVQALEALGGHARYSDLYAYWEKNADGPLPKNWKSSIRGRIEENSSESKAFKGDQDLFYPVCGLGRGVWGLKNKLQRSPVAIDRQEPRVISEGRDKPYKVKTEITRTIRDTSMTKQLKVIYKYRCQICDQAILLHNALYVEAHHLRPLGRDHKGSDDMGNILIVCPNHHAEFDYCAIAINPLDNTITHLDRYYPFIGKTVLFHPLHKINKRNLEYHMDLYLEFLNK